MPHISSNPITGIEDFIVFGLVIGFIVMVAVIGLMTALDKGEEE